MQGNLHYLHEIHLPNQKSITHRKISILQEVNKIISIRLTPKLFMSLAKVYVNQDVEKVYVNQDVD